MPAGRTFLSSMVCSSGLKANLFRLPFGVSITTRSRFLSLGSVGFSRVGSASPFFFLIYSPNHAYRWMPRKQVGFVSKGGLTRCERGWNRLRGKPRAGTFQRYPQEPKSSLLHGIHNQPRHGAWHLTSPSVAVRSLP